MWGCEGKGKKQHLFLSAVLSVNTDYKYRQFLNTWAYLSTKELQNITSAVVTGCISAMFLFAFQQSLVVRSFSIETAAVPKHSCRWHKSQTWRFRLTSLAISGEHIPKWLRDRGPTRYQWHVDPSLSKSIPMSKAEEHLPTLQLYLSTLLSILEEFCWGQMQRDKGA